MELIRVIIQTSSRGAFNARERERESLPDCALGVVLVCMHLPFEKENVGH